MNIIDSTATLTPIRFIYEDTALPQIEVYQQQRKVYSNNPHEEQDIDKSLKKVFKKETIYCDIDDVVLLSSQTVIDIMNKRYKIEPPKTFNDCKDWGYRSIYKGITAEEIEGIYDSDEFFQLVRINSEFLFLLKRPYIKEYNLCFVSKGTRGNIQKKQEFLSRHFPKLDYTFIGLINGVKEIIDMSDGLQIDDNYKYMEHTNARYKFLLKNGIETNYNKNPIPQSENLYIINDLHEFGEVLEFQYKTKGGLF